MTLDDLIALEEIRTLRYRYSQLADAGELSALSALFTPDATCDLGAHFGGAHVGKDAIHAGFMAFAAMAATPHEIMHVVSNPVIRLTGPASATGRWYLQNLLAKAEAPQPILMLGIYEDSYHRDADGWRFASMRLHSLWPQRSFTGFVEDNSAL